MPKVPYWLELVQRIAPELGVSVYLEPEWGHLLELTFPSGKRHLMLKSNLGINNSVAMDIAKDKAYTAHLLRRQGMEVPEGRVFSSPRQNAKIEGTNGIDKAIEYVRQIGFPIYAKPNDGSQGNMVMRVTSEGELRSIAATVFEVTDSLLIEKARPGMDFRLFVYNSEVYFAYRRSPFTVIGDGLNTVNDLIKIKIENFKTVIKRNPKVDISDIRFDKVLRRQGFTRDSIIPKGKPVVLLDNANLSTGGDAEDVTTIVHPSFKELAIKAAKTVGLRLAGVDFLASDISAPADSQTYTILELNSCPGVRYYAHTGSQQKMEVENLCRRILGDLMVLKG